MQKTRYPYIGQQNADNVLYRLNNEFNWKFHEHYLYWQTFLHWPSCGYLSAHPHLMQNLTQEFLMWVFGRTVEKLLKPLDRSFLCTPQVPGNDPRLLPEKSYCWKDGPLLGIISASHVWRLTPLFAATQSFSTSLAEVT